VLWGILLAQQMLVAIKCFIDDNFVFQRHNASVRSAQFKC